MRRRVLVVFETHWDRPQLEACRPAWSEAYELAFSEPSDDDCRWDLPVLEHLARETERWRGAIAGVFSTSDYPGAPFAAALAEALGLPGTPPEVILRASQKHASRLAQREVVPAAVPAFSLLDPDDPSTWDPEPGFPCFVKPVKGSFSILSGVRADRAELGAFLRSTPVANFRSGFITIFNKLAAHYGLDHDGRWFLAEGLLTGHQVTVEGWRSRSEGGILGVVDTLFHPATRSFAGFTYPSRLPADVQARLCDVAERAARHLGLVDTLYNVELTWDPETDRLGIVEINPRGCGQFGDLYQKVDGTNGYEVALALAAGVPPRLRPGAGACGAAASFPLRVYEPTRVVRAPDVERVRAVQERHPGTIVLIECETGELMSHFGQLEDGHSQRYAVLNVGGDDHEDVRRRCAAVQAELGFELAPLSQKR